MPPRHRSRRGRDFVPGVTLRAGCADGPPGVLPGGAGLGRGHRHAADRGDGGRRAPPAGGGGAVRVDRGAKARRQRPAAARGLHVPGHRRRRRARRRHRLRAGTLPRRRRLLPGRDGGWIYVSNSEVSASPGAGGASAVRFDADGAIVGAHRILDGTTATAPADRRRGARGSRARSASTARAGCGSATPPASRRAVARPALGRFAHEAVAVDPDGRGAVPHRGRPRRPALPLHARRLPRPLRRPARGRRGRRRTARSPGREVPDPAGAADPDPRAGPRRHAFNGGEGIWYHDGTICVHDQGRQPGPRHRPRRAALRAALRDGDRLGTDAGLTGVDNITVAPAPATCSSPRTAGTWSSCSSPPTATSAPFVAGRRPDHGGTSHRAGVLPDGTRLYFSSPAGPDARNAHRDRRRPRRRGGQPQRGHNVGGDGVRSARAHMEAARPRRRWPARRRVPLQTPRATATARPPCCRSPARRWSWVPSAPAHWWVRSRRTAAAPTAGPSAGPSPGDNPGLVGSPCPPGVRPVDAQGCSSL